MARARNLLDLLMCGTSLLQRVECPKRHRTNRHKIPYHQNDTTNHNEPLQFRLSHDHSFLDLEKTLNYHCSSNAERVRGSTSSPQAYKLRSKSSYASTHTNNVYSNQRKLKKGTQTLLGRLQNICSPILKIIPHGGRVHAVSLSN